MDKRYTTEYIMRARIPIGLFKRFKVICAELDLSIPKQIAAVIQSFVETHEENIERIKQAKK